MRPSEYVVLEFLADHDVALGPRPLHFNLERKGHDIGYSTVRAALDDLGDMGLVEKVSEKRGYYEVTDRGRAYLAGELTEEDLTDE